MPQGADVALKVNLGWDLFIPGSITSPLVTEALIGAIRDHVGTIYMVESDQVLEDVENCPCIEGRKGYVLAVLAMPFGVETETASSWVGASKAVGLTIS